jgi:AhpD family alkylhydroperoxidase
MSEHYHDVGDLRFLKEMVNSRQPNSMHGLHWTKLLAAMGGAIPRKYRELIALGVAFTTQCPYCIEVHTKAAKAAGVSRGTHREFFDYSCVTGWRRRDHGAMALKFYDQS